MTDHTNDGDKYYSINHRDISLQASSCVRVCMWCVCASPMVDARAFNIDVRNISVRVVRSHCDDHAMRFSSKM